ncbi:hypothetical protein IPN35_03305 [Candidatus Peregrinibacteria bacterium]|nr:MAG: hypothetical protein IPN35_03305 [Candidatus Peregrinibacteria bacterium]
MRHVLSLLCLGFLLSACVPSVEAPETSSATDTLASHKNGTGPLAEFATCLTDSGAVFYGTEWCPHCKKQKAMFGDALGNVPYIDCDANRSTCQKEGITGYPTWKFKNGAVLSGTQPLSDLAKQTGCVLPDNMKI